MILIINDMKESTTSDFDDFVCLLNIAKYKNSERLSLRDLLKRDGTRVDIFRTTKS